MDPDGAMLEVDTMPPSKPGSFTAEDYWNLPEGVRAELIDGELYDMAPPTRVHQKIVLRISRVIDEFIERHNGECEVYPAPFAVNLNADDSTYVEPDVSVICDPSKLTSRGCTGAPDFIAEVVSPSSRRMDYLTKGGLYSNAGVREYWVVDPEKSKTTVYDFENENFAPIIYPFSSPIPVGIYPGLTITIAELLK